MAFPPVVPFRQKTSERPSPSKSPTAATYHCMFSTGMTGGCLVESPERQISLEPVLALRQKTSDSPSPSKSPTPAIFHARSGRVVREYDVDSSPDFQTQTAPVT